MSVIQNLALHFVGNKQADDGVICSKTLLDTNDEMRNILHEYFLQVFLAEEQFHFIHENELKFNEVYSIVSDIFDDPESLYINSVKLAKRLYEKSDHPKIKAGEFYVVHFTDCTIAGEHCDAVGLFKSENKDTFLRVWTSMDGLDLTPEQGINTKKLDKGCLIYNVERENGYLVTIVDNTNRSDAHFWTDEFLHVFQKANEYFHTNTVLSLTKNFVTKELPQQFEVSKADQADLLNRSVAFFKEKETFDMDEFVNEVIEQPAVIESFHKFKDNYAQREDIEIADSFEINGAAVKKQARAFKSVIKLDKNFHIYIHGDRDLIEQGEDERGKFYKVYYNKEM
ncbi:MAG: nucleoid-associated protein [Bacteroidales bacterium]|nr:nucleoid-associated protein [Bacteroidales bacterium]